jgi:hypothetical protein
LHQRPGGAEEAENPRGFLGVAANEIDDQLRQHRNGDAHRQHVQQNGREDKDEGGFASRRAGLSTGLSHQRRFRPA